MILRTKYSIGDQVWGIGRSTEYVKRPCTRCDGKGELELKEGGTLPCPNRYAFHDGCNGGQVTLGVLMPWKVQADTRGHIGQVRITRTMGRLRNSHDDDRNEYMVTTTGVGSGRVWKEEELFPSFEDAQAECDRRNADPLLDETRDNLRNGYCRDEAERRAAREEEAASEPNEENDAAVESPSRLQPFTQMTLTPFIYLLNAMEHAAQSADPSANGYAEKRLAVLERVREMEEAVALLDYASEHFAAASFRDEQIPDRTVLKITVPHGTAVSVDLKQTLERGMDRERRRETSELPHDDAGVSRG